MSNVLFSNRARLTTSEGWRWNQNFFCVEKVHNLPWLISDVLFGLHHLLRKYIWLLQLAYRECTTTVKIWLWAEKLIIELFNRFLIKNVILRFGRKYKSDSTELVFPFHQWGENRDSSPAMHDEWCTLSVFFHHYCFSLATVWQPICAVITADLTLPAVDSDERNNCSLITQSLLKCAEPLCLISLLSSCFNCTNTFKFPSNQQRN